MTEAWVHAEVVHEEHLQLLLPDEESDLQIAEQEEKEAQFDTKELQHAEELTPELVKKAEQWLLLHPQQAFPQLLEEAVFMGKSLHGRLLLRMFVPAQLHAGAFCAAVETLLRTFVGATSADAATAAAATMDVGTSNRLRNLLLQLCDYEGASRRANGAFEGERVLRGKQGEALPLCVLDPRELLRLLLPFASSSAVIASLVGPVCERILGLPLSAADKERMAGLLQSLERAVGDSYRNEKLHAQGIHALESAFVKLAVRNCALDALPQEAGPRPWIASVTQWWMADNIQEIRLQEKSLSLEDALDIKVRLPDVLSLLGADDDAKEERRQLIQRAASDHMERQLRLLELPVQRTVRYVAAVVTAARRWSGKHFSAYVSSVLAEHARLLEVADALLLLPQEHRSALTASSDDQRHLVVAALLLGMCTVAIRVQVVCSSDAVLSTAVTARFVQLAMNEVDDLLIKAREDVSSISTSSTSLWRKHIAVVLAALLSQARQHSLSCADRVFLTLHGLVRDHDNMTSELLELVGAGKPRE